MPNEDSGNTPPNDPQSQSFPQSPVIPTTPQQNEMRKQAANDPHNKENETARLQRDIKIGEICLIAINFLLLVTTIIIAIIYSGQLKEMRKATKATQLAADAASRQVALSEKA